MLTACAHEFGCLLCPLHVAEWLYDSFCLAETAFNLQTHCSEGPYQACIVFLLSRALLLATGAWSTLLSASGHVLLS